MPRTAKATSATKSAAVTPAATKPAANKAQPPKPVTRRDVLDVDRADAEGMAQPQGKKPRRRRR